MAPPDVPTADVHKADEPTADEPTADEPPRAPASDRSRSSLVPNANNPRLLGRLVQLVAGGIRRPRALAELLDVELRTVHNYTQAGEWLGLLATDKEVHLTRRGMELAFADSRQRGRIYAMAVWGNSFASRLMAGRPTLPDADAIASFILELEPDMAPSTARRRAAAVRGLIEPAIGHRPGRSDTTSVQLALPFAFGAPGLAQHLAVGSHPLDLRTGIEDNPDAYARLLRVLLDNGELSLGQLRASLDQMGAQDGPLGSYVDMATRRGDATRHGDRIVVTAGAVRRREVAGDGVLVALSDPAYRARLAALASPSLDPMELRDRSRLAARFAAWDVRIFGVRLEAADVDEHVGRLLPGRQLNGLPLAGEPGPALPVTDLPFVDLLDVPGLPVSFPSALSVAAGKVPVVNDLLAAARASPAGVRPPGPVDPRVCVHGGLLHPGESLPRVVPDNVSLRLRALTHAPALSILTALLLLDRRPGVPLRLVERGQGPTITWGRYRLGPVVPLLDAFCVAQGWVCSRPAQGGTDGRRLLDLSGHLGISDRVDARFVLDEALFLRLQEDPEGRFAHDGLVPLEDRLHAWLEAL